MSGRLIAGDSLLLTATRRLSHFPVYSCICSVVDRCSYFHSSMMSEAWKPSSYVCSAKLSKTLPLWSNARHCAECPPLENFTYDVFQTSTNFGLVDDDAAVYFDFWSEAHTKLHIYMIPRQSMHDVNGPFNSTCSASRETNAFGLAGGHMIFFVLAKHSNFKERNPICD